MMDSKIEDDFWNASSSSTFNFDDDEDLELPEMVFNPPVKETAHLPIHSVISKNSLSIILNDIKIQENPSPPVEETITKMFYDLNYHLDVYKSLAEKLSLLDAAIKSCDGKIILAVILFLKRTLKHNIFINELSKKKIATNHYLNYLISKNNFHELADVYMATGNLNKMRDVYFLSSKNVQNSRTLQQKLEQFMNEHSQIMNNDEKKDLKSNLDFLKWQVDQQRNCSSVVEQLAKLCKEVVDNNKNFEILYNFKKQFNVDDFQFEWTILSTFCRLKQWEKLIGVFIKPAWLTKKAALKSVIRPDVFILSLSRFNPPKEILEQFLSFVTDNERNLFLAMKLNLYKSVINYYVNQRDRVALLQYKERIPAQSEEHLLIENALISDKKWKN